ncbi:MAG: sigma 54-interacting transcriptional regulator [Myxococcales bacterium]|nr:sigma 54-interacting transcriptional regulator [Myxococcales bacterium]
MSENDEDGFPDDATTKLVKPKGRAEPFVLVVVDGPSRGKRAPLTKGTAKVGSSSICELAVDDRAVSRIHYEVTATSRGLSLRDLGSTNGTFVAGLGVSLATIPPGALILAGGTTVRVEGSGDGFALPGVSTGEAFGGLFGKSVAMRQVFAILERAAPSDATVLLRGETGTGKEVAARAIHDASPRARGPFVAVDCGAIPEALFESELFGHARGPLTGASCDRAGGCEEAHQGTLFLDEIGELPCRSRPSSSARSRRGRSVASAPTSSAPSTSASSRPRIGRWSRRSMAVPFAKISTTASRSSRFCCRLCANVPPTSRSSRTASTKRAAGEARCRPSSWRRSRGDRSPATCASSNTPSNAPSC